MKELKLFIVCVFASISLTAQTYIDKPFVQDYADKFDLSNNPADVKLLQVRSDRNKRIIVLSSEELLQPWGKKLTKNQLYRPLTDMNIIAIERCNNQFVYLTDKAVLSNAWAGKFYIDHGIINPTHFVVAPDFTTLIAAKGKLVLFQNRKKIWNKTLNGFEPIKMIFDENGKRFLILTDDAVYQLKSPEKELSKVYSGINLTAITIHDNKIVIGTNDGVIYLNEKTFVLEKTDKKLPCTEITTTNSIGGNLWFGSTKGAFKLRKDLSAGQAGGKYDYYASKRWLVDDEVIDISKGSDNRVLVLTKKGLSQINFVAMTLTEKAAYFQKIQRLRHIRYGMTSELSLATPGDVSTGIYGDTDNDGLWTSMYLAAELFRYAVTKSEDAKLNAYEAFEGMERLTAITGLDGFPARTYERDGYEMGMETNGFSEEWRLEYIKKNGRIWQLSEDKRWRWKSNTSSDESAGHFFAYALFAELAPDKEWRDRAIHQIKIEADHLIENDWYLTDWNGKPTAWGKFNPKYVNSYPMIVGDRRLNSTLILAFLQSAYHFTGDKKYKKKAYQLINTHGYEENASSPPIPDDIMKKGSLMDYGVEWNHSDDEMYFLTAPAFVNYSFTDEQKQKHFKAVKGHWEMERSEKNPLWNFIYALVGGTDYDLDESVWWLKEFPMDLVLWSIKNSDRKDLVRIEPNIRGQEYSEVLPPDECPVHLFNGAYHNNSNSAAAREDPPYLFLLPYWAGRYVEAISAPSKKK
ncbi:MAG: hypothetical protein DRI95_12035 [Bacteroidetes bacterium]|nr:MAG: hypothetical protein DRI95_12035 [Bacteroidota bacterium]